MSEKQQAVLKSNILWAWLERNPTALKSEYPNYVNHNLEYSSCPVCRYDTEHATSRLCGACPMLGRWPSIKGDELLLECGSVGAIFPYYNQVAGRGDQKRASLYEGRIASALWKLYKELEDK